jgi:hypothetical protein
MKMMCWSSSVADEGCQLQANDGSMLVDGFQDAEPEI